MYVREMNKEKAKGWRGISMRLYSLTIVQKSLRIRHNNIFFELQTKFYFQLEFENKISLLPISFRRSISIISLGLLKNMICL